MLLLTIPPPVFRWKHRGDTAHNLLCSRVDIFACDLCATRFEDDRRAESDGYTRAELFQHVLAAPDRYRHDRDARTQRNHTQACVSLCHGMSLAACALWKYEENFAFLQLFAGGTDGLAVAFAARDTQCAHRTHYPPYIAAGRRLPPAQKH